MRDFYDQLAESYHLLYPDWEASAMRQARALNGLVRHQRGTGPQTILDCACGIGTQAVGSAVREYSRIARRPSRSGWSTITWRAVQPRSAGTSGASRVSSSTHPTAG